MKRKSSKFSRRIPAAIHPRGALLLSLSVYPVATGRAETISSFPAGRERVESPRLPAPPNVMNENKTDSHEQNFSRPTHGTKSTDRPTKPTRVADKASSDGGVQHLLRPLAESSRVWRFAPAGSFARESSTSVRAVVAVCVCVFCARTFVF